MLGWLGLSEAKPRLVRQGKGVRGSGFGKAMILDA